MAYKIPLGRTAEQQARFIRGDLEASERAVARGDVYGIFAGQVERLKKDLAEVEALIPPRPAKKKRKKR